MTDVSPELTALPRPTMGRLSVAINVALLDELEAACDERMVGKALVVAKALEAYLPTLRTVP